MEPPNHHCLGWEWVSRKHIGWAVVGSGGYSQMQPACQTSAWHWEQLVWVDGKQKRCHSLPVVCTYWMLGSGCDTHPSLLRVGPQNMWETVQKSGPLVRSWSVWLRSTLVFCVAGGSRPDLDYMPGHIILPRALGIST